MERVAKFSTVSERRFVKDWCGTDPELAPEEKRREAEAVYASIRLPQRATKGSAGYDFYTPAEICLAPGESAKIATGIRAEMNEDWVLLLMPRSSLGFKYKLELNNTVGVIDSDYYYSDNEGHIFIKLTNSDPEGKTLHLSAGQAFAQGIFVMYGITVDDVSERERNGGFGSTDAKQRRS